MTFLILLISFGLSYLNTNEVYEEKVNFKHEMLSAVNAQRANACYCGNTYNKAVPPVRWNALLEESASNYATEMRQKKFFDHKGPDGSTIGVRAKRVGYHYSFIGENLGVGPKRIPEIIQAWMDSPSHCALIMNPNFNELGAAKDGLYWVQHFGRK